MNVQNQENIKDKLEETIKKMADFMNLECQVEIKDEVEDKGIKALVVSIYTPTNVRFLIGKNGQNLKSFEQVLRVMFLKNEPEFTNINVDVNDYKKSKATYAIDLAHQAVTRVRNTQKSEALLPMPPYERRVVHMELASLPDIATESIGEEPNRRIVIKPYP